MSWFVGEGEWVWTWVLMSMAMLLGAGRRGMWMVELHEARAGRTVMAALGEEVRVSLREAGGAGYRWQVGPGCDGILHLERETSAADTTPGGGVERVWMFRVVGEGRCNLRFEFRRSWEKGVTGKVVVFPVVVGG